MTVNVGIRMSNIGEYLRVFVVDVEKEEMYEMDMPNTLKDMKRLTGAGCIDIDDILIGDMQLKAIFGSTVNDKMHISCINPEGKTVYRGNIIIVASRKEPDGVEMLCGLNDEEIKALLYNTGLMTIDASGNTGEKYNAYVLCNIKVKQ